MEWVVKIIIKCHLNGETKGTHDKDSSGDMFETLKFKVVHWRQVVKLGLVYLEDKESNTRVMHVAKAKLETHPGV